ncbi:3'-5' exonuclease [Halomonas sp. HP20-15]|nr:3'-5' exonuclease [Halomonas sp. HP20-15]MDW5376606.1 3'-5' exonuclease [Halomonas sp. HP20-15]
MRLFSRLSKQVPDWPAYLASRATRARDPRLERYYAAGTPGPETPVGDVPLVALDLETTGLDASRHSIVSIGVLPFTLERIRLGEARYWVVAPRRSLSNESVTFHHITHAEVADAPDLEDILDDLLECLAGRLAVVHYRPIEREFLDAAMHDRVDEHLLFPMIDTMSLEAVRHRRRRWLWLQRLVGRPPASVRLHESRQRYNLPAYTGHHALSDALATAELFQAQIARHYSWQTPVGTFWR